MNLVRRKQLARNIYDMTVEEFVELVKFEINCIRIDDLKGKNANRYMAQEYIKKFESFLEIESAKKHNWRNVRDILNNLKAWRQDCTVRQEINLKKIELIRRIKKLKGQISLIDDFSMLTTYERNRAEREPDNFIKELKVANMDLGKDKKLCNFMLAYIVNRNFMDAL